MLFRMLFFFYYFEHVASKKANSISLSGSKICSYFTINVSTIQTTQLGFMWHADYDSDFDV